MSSTESGETSDPARSIPAAIKRSVRKECGFGCAICGCPVFHYDHIEEFSEVKEHKAENIVLLCEMHHGAKTTGKLSKDRVRAAKLSPYNVGRRSTGAYQVEPARNVNVMLGSNRSITRFGDDGQHIVLQISGRNAFLLHSEGGWLTVSFVITNPDGQLLLLVKEGELSLSPFVWDYEYVGSRLTIRTGSREIFADITLSDTEVIIHRGCVALGRLECVVQPDGALVVYCDGEMGSYLSECVAGANPVGSFGFYDMKVIPGIAGFGFARGFP